MSGAASLKEKLGNIFVGYTYGRKPVYARDRQVGIPDADPPRPVGIVSAVYQFGDFNDSKDIDQDALGCKLEGGFTFKDAPMSPRPFIGYSFLEGDDPDTKDKGGDIGWLAETSMPAELAADWLPQVKGWSAGQLQALLGPVADFYGLMAQEAEVIACGLPGHARDLARALEAWS